MMLKIQFLPWDRHKHVAELNWLMGSLLMYVLYYTFLGYFCIRQIVPNFSLHWSHIVALGLDRTDLEQVPHGCFDGPGLEEMSPHVNKFKRVKRVLPFVYLGSSFWYLGLKELKFGTICLIQKYPKNV
jgi:hypothetical protein